MKTKMKKILITGSNGMLGKDILNELKFFYDCYGFNRKIDNKLDVKKSVVCDLTDKDNLSRNLQLINPNIIIHTAAMVDIEKCQFEQIECMETNFNSIKIILENIAKETLFIFISSDSVFDGVSKFPDETSIKNPLNYYSKSKSYAEDFIINNHKNHVIIRTNMYGFHDYWRGSLVEWAISSLKKNTEFSGYDDVYFNPLYTKQIARAIHYLTDLNFKGVIHLGSTTTLTKYEFLLEICHLFNFDRRLIFKTSIDEIDSVKRPKHTALNIEKSIQLLIGFDFSLEQGLKLLKEDLSLYWSTNYENQ